MKKDNGFIERPQKKPSRLFCLIILFLVVYLIFSFTRVFLAINRLEEEVRVAEKELKTLEQSNQELEEEIQLLHTDEYIERLAREKMGLVKEGEIPYILISE